MPSGPVDFPWAAGGMSGGWDGDSGWNLGGYQDVSSGGEVPFDFGSDPFDSTSDWNSWCNSFDDDGSAAASGTMDGSPPTANPGIAPSPAPAATAPMTTATLGWPTDPLIGHRKEKSYELHTVTTTLTTGFDVYTLGMTVETTFVTDTSTAGENPVVKGDGTAKFTFQKFADGVLVPTPDPEWETWHIDTSASPTAPTTPPAVSANPFAALLPAVGTNWSKVEISDRDTQLTNGLHNDSGLQYWYSSADTSNSDTAHARCNHRRRRLGGDRPDQRRLLEHLHGRRLEKSGSARAARLDDGGQPFERNVRAESIRHYDLRERNRDSAECVRRRPARRHRPDQGRAPRLQRQADRQHE